MDQDTARIGAQQLDHESPKQEVPPDYEKRISDEPSPQISQTSIDSQKPPPAKEDHDLEAAYGEEVVPAPVKVPRSKRRGLFGRFTLLAEVEEPKHYSRRIKWWITFIIALAAVAAPMGSAIIFRKSDIPLRFLHHQCLKDRPLLMHLEKSLHQYSRGQNPLYRVYTSFERRHWLFSTVQCNLHFSIVMMCLDQLTRTHLSLFPLVPCRHSRIFTYQSQLRWVRYL